MGGGGDLYETGRNDPLDGGPCPEIGTVYFVPIEVAPGLPRRPAHANFSKDGEFSVTSFDEGDGLIPGTYRVRIECWKEKPKDDGTPGVSWVKSGFQVPDLVVASGSDTIEREYDVPGRP